MEKVNKLTRSTMAFAIFQLLGKVFGFARESLIAYYFGAGIETDAFNTSLKATSILSLMVSNAIATTFIPMLARVEDDEGKERVNYHTNNMIVITVLIALIMSVLGVVLSPYIISVVGGGFGQETFDLAVKLTKIEMPVIIFSAIVGVMTGYLQHNGRFAATGAVAVPLNVVYIGYLIFLSSSFGIFGLAVASALGILAQAIFLYPDTKRAGMEYFPVFEPKDKYVNHAITLAVPVLLSTAINDINIIVNNRLASKLQVGTVTWLNYANKLNVMILGVFVSAVTAVVFPIMSRAFSSGDSKGGVKSMAAAVRLILLITVPAAVGLIVLAEPIVEVAFQRGEFTTFDTQMTASALRFYSMALCAMSLNTLLNRVYYSLQNTRTPLVIGGVSVAINVVMNLILINFMGHNGLALGLSIAMNASVLISFMVLRKQIGQIYGFSYIRTIIKTLLASLVMGAVAYFAYYGIISLAPSLALGTAKKLLVLMVAVLAAVATYGGLCFAMGVTEMKLLVSMVKSKLKR